VVAAPVPYTIVRNYVARRIHVPRGVAVISEDALTGYINTLFGHSEPGATLHHLLVAAAKPGDVDAFGVANCEVSMYAIAPDDTVDTDQFVAKVIIAAGVDAYKAGCEIHFAGLAMELQKVDTSILDEVEANRARRMQADGKLPEHPAAIEITRLYAVCRDGRRWVGDHYLTGPMAGTVLGPDIRIGGLAADERSFRQQLLRKLIQGPPL